MFTIEEQYERIYRYCYFKLHNTYLAEDITQETFLRYLTHYKKMAGTPLAILYTIARNLCMDEFRRTNREVVSWEFPEETVGETFEGKIISNLSLQQAIQELGAEDQELILLRYVNEVPVRVLCQIYHISRFALYRRLKGILNQLEGRLTDET